MMRAQKQALDKELRVGQSEPDVLGDEWIMQKVFWRVYQLGDIALTCIRVIPYARFSYIFGSYYWLSFGSPSRVCEHKHRRDIASHEEYLNIKKGIYPARWLNNANVEQD